MKHISRKEEDVLGMLNVPKNVYWGINTQRALQNFRISERKIPATFILALTDVKKSCLEANYRLKKIDKERHDAILKAINEVLKGKFLDQFPIDVFGTGSGTHINMNVNEVLANRANEILGHPLGRNCPIHPNDHVNQSQSSNDVIPTAMQLSVLELLSSELFPSLRGLENALGNKIKEFRSIVKVGRTHLQDAVPIPLSMEFEVYRRQIAMDRKRLDQACNELCFIPIGGTAVGTGVNASKEFARLTVANLRKITGFPFKENPVKAEGIASHKSIVRTSADLHLLALSLLKMSNDIRWMGSGPRAGLGELILPPNEPGSSIMPGKINPTQAEALVQVCLQVIGNDTTVSLAEMVGSTLDLNVAKPVMMMNLLDSIALISKGIDSFVNHCLRDLKANEQRINEDMKDNLMVAVMLTPLVGYDKAAEIAERARKTGKSIKEAVLDMGIKIEGDLDELLDPTKMV